jgi:hypothetical protein
MRRSVEGGAQAISRAEIHYRGKTHFGWARLNVSCVYLHAMNATLTGYAYEAIPNKSIVTGETKGPDVEPATLGDLARGTAQR